MTGSPYRTALLGTGRIGSHHARTIHREVHGLDLVLLADPVAGIARTLADELGVERAGTDPVAAATDGDVDAVVITTPARTHVDLAAAAIEAGKHVFVEKPMALTVAEPAPPVVVRPATRSCYPGIVASAGSVGS